MLSMIILEMFSGDFASLCQSPISYLYILMYYIHLDNGIEISKFKCWEHEFITIQQIISYAVHQMYRVKE